MKRKPLRIRRRWKAAKSPLPPFVGWRSEAVELSSTLTNPHDTLLGRPAIVAHRMSIVITNGKDRKRITLRSNDAAIEDA